ncbi:MAG: stage V sporulation protein S [Thermomicrobiaceae bacterium]|nr:stage V sporulation protein S [Thermomicrobiaceae bacterium]
MDRFFSKLDLRDIKIDPDASFPPDEDAYEPEETLAETNGHGTVTDSAGVTTSTRRSDVLKVSARSRPSAVAGAIAGVVRESGRAEVQAIGAGATNQAVKAVAIARDYLLETGIEAVCLPAFIDVTIDNESRTAIRLIVEVR